MGQSPSTLLSDQHHDDPSSTNEPALLAADILGPLILLADLRRDAFFGDVHYESSIEGDMLLPLDKVVTEGAEMWVSRHHHHAEEEGREVEKALGGLLCPEVVGALGVTFAAVLEGARREVGEAGKRKGAGQRVWAERRGFAIAVGHLGGIYRLNYLLHLQPLHSQTLSTLLHPTPTTTSSSSNPQPPPPTFITAAWALSSVRIDWLSLNALNIAIEQSFLHAPGESHADFRVRMKGVKDVVLRDWDEDQVREAGVERRKRRVGAAEGVGEGIGGGGERVGRVRFEGEGKGTGSEGRGKVGQDAAAAAAVDAAAGSEKVDGPGSGAGVEPVNAGSAGVGDGVNGEVPLR